MSSDVLLLLFLSAALGVEEVLGVDSSLSIDMTEWAKSGKSTVLKHESDQLVFTLVRPKCTDGKIIFGIDGCEIIIEWMNTDMLQINEKNVEYSGNITLTSARNGTTANVALKEKLRCFLKAAHSVYFTVMQAAKIPSCPVMIEFVNVTKTEEDCSFLPFPLPAMLGATAGAVIVVEAFVFILCCLARKCKKPKEKEDSLFAAILAGDIEAIERKQKERKMVKRLAKHFEKPSDSVMGRTPRGRKHKQQKKWIPGSEWTPYEAVSPSVLLGVPRPPPPPMKKSKKRREASPRSVEKTVESRRHCTDYSTEATE